MKLAVNQPYFFPYIGYFQLMKAVDQFIFYDDVDFIKRGWINRNEILINGEGRYFTVPCIKSSQNRKINEIEFDSGHPDYRKLLKTLRLAYANAPYYDQVFPLVESVMNAQTTKIAELAMESIRQTAEYLELDVSLLISSENFPETNSLQGEERIIALCKESNAAHYINLPDGETYYKKENFTEEGINLHFISPEIVPYEQFNDDFIPRLSIIDVMMFNSVEEIQRQLEQYQLV